jgi:hypothetical protein
MAIHKLKPAFVQTVREKGMYSDGGGLYLQVRDTKSWVFRFARSRFGGVGGAVMGLGPASAIGLSEARELAREYRQQVVQGIDPLEARRSDQRARQLAASKNMTFGECAEAYLSFAGKRWKPSTDAGVRNLLQNHVYPKLKKTPLAEIDHLQLAQVLTPIFESTPVTAAQARMRVQEIFAYATQKGWRAGDNPASLKGPLGVTLPRLSDVHTVEHHKSLSYE